jgi:PhzF family phenazine biosynthesis protein
MEFKFETYDVFTDTVLKGNPLAVVTIPPNQDLPQETKQAIAKEFNLSETVFIHETDDPSSKERQVDIFTPARELPFAGHPTIGSAVSLQAAGITTLNVKAGTVEISYPAVGKARAEIPHNVRIHAKRLRDLQPPPVDLSPRPVHSHAELNAPIVSIVNGMNFCLTELPSLEELASVVRTALDFRTDEILDEGWRNGIITRYYFVRLGKQARDGETVHVIRTRLVRIELEDPGTGSAASALSSYLSLAGELEAPKHINRFEITQGVEMGRESQITIETHVSRGGDGPVNLDKVFMSGSARKVMSGTIHL